MSLNKCKKQTQHSIERLNERVGEEFNESVIRSASKHGKCPNDFKEYESIYNYISKVSNHKRVKLYKGVVFIFNNTSDRCLTCYLLPEEYREEYKEFLNNQYDLGRLKTKQVFFKTPL